MDIRLLEILDLTAYFLGSMLFPLWPFFVMSAVRARRNILANMLLAWILMSLVGVASLFSSMQNPPMWTFIPQPWNGIAFVSTGFVLVVAMLTRKYWRKGRIMRKAERASGSDELLNLSPREFEEAVVELYRVMGHKSRRTGSVGDHGVDVVVDTSGGEKWIVQCKRWRGIVGEAVIRDFYGVLHHEKADRGAVITTGTFSFQARQWARGKPIELVDGDEFLRLLKSARKTASSENGVRVI
jgi:hypothetical protein